MIATITLNPSIDRTLQVEHLVPGGLNRVQQKIDHPSGKGINVSRALQRLDEPTQALGLIGGDTGRWLVAALKKLGIPFDYVEVKGETRINLKIWAAADEQETEINEPGPRVTGAELAAFRNRVLAQAREWDWVVISGSVPPGTPATYCGELVEAARSRGARVVLDTSGPSLREGLKARPDMIKPNRAEAEELLGCEIKTKAEAKAAVRRFLELGIPYVILTLGKEGALYGHGGQIAWGIPPEVPVRTTMGCGDSTIAGTLHGLMQGESFLEAMRWGLAVGAAAATTWGTEWPALEYILELREKVIIHPSI